MLVRVRIFYVGSLDLANGALGVSLSVNGGSFFLLALEFLDFGGCASSISVP